MTRIGRDTHMGKTTESLTKKDWIEIYYALETKIWAILNGHYGPEFQPGDDVRWVQQIEEIKKKVGSDGQKMWPKS